jgi:hypothetical protein
MANNNDHILHSLGQQIGEMTLQSDGTSPGSDRKKKESYSSSRVLLHPAHLPLSLMAFLVVSQPISSSRWRPLSKRTCAFLKLLQPSKPKFLGAR